MTMNCSLTSFTTRLRESHWICTMGLSLILISKAPIYLIRFGIFLAVPSWDKMRIFISLPLWVLRVRLRVAAAAALVAQSALEELGVMKALRLYTTPTIAYPLEWSAGFTMRTPSRHKMAIGSCTSSLLMLMVPHCCCLLCIVPTT